MTTILAKFKSDLEAAYPNGSSYQVILLSDLTRSTRTFTVDTSTDTITTSTNHDYLAGTKVQVSNSGGTLPSPLVAATTYYVRDVGSNTLKLAATLGGSTIDLTTTGSGTHTITDVALDATDDSVAQWVRKEVASYQGINSGARPTWTPPATATIVTSPSQLVQLTANVSLNNSSGGSAVSFDTALLIVGGSTTLGNTTGTALDYLKYGSAQTVAAGETYQIKIDIKQRNA